MYDFENDNSIPEESKKNMDLPKIESAVRDILEAIGEDPDREGLKDTPQRVARMYAEVFAGLHDGHLASPRLQFGAQGVDARVSRQGALLYI